MTTSTVTLLTSGTGSTATTTVSFSAQSAGTLLVLIYGGDDYRTTSGSGRPESTGWTLISDQHTFLGHAMWYKVASGSETSVQYTIGSSSPSCYLLITATNVNGTTPLDVSNGQFAQSLASSYTTPTVSASAGDKVAIGSIGGSHTSTITSLTSWTNSYTSLGSATQTTAFTKDIIGAAYLNLTGAASTSTGATYTGGPNSAEARTGIIAVFNLSAGGSSVTGNVSTTTTASLTAAGTAQFVGGASLTATANRTTTGNNSGAQGTSPSTTASLSATGTVAKFGTTSPTTTATFTADGLVSKLLDSSLTVTASPTATGQLAAVGNTSLTGTAVITADGQHTAVGLSSPTFTAALTADGVVTGSNTGAATPTFTATLTAAGVRAASSGVSQGVSAALTADGTVTPPVGATRSVTASVTASGGLALVGASSLATVAVLTADGIVGALVVPKIRIATVGRYQRTSKATRSGSSQTRSTQVPKR